MGLPFRCAVVPTFLVAMLSSIATGEDFTTASSEVSSHPLMWTVRYAESRSDYIRSNVRDYSCRLIKRERIDGKLQEHQFARVKVRCEQRRDGRVVQPLSVLIQYLAPSSLKGRTVLFIEGKNSGKMLVRKGGPALNFLRLRIDPNGKSARRESNYSITDVGFDKIIDRLNERVRADIQRDPLATNTLVSHFRNAKIDDRVCTHIQVVHPARDNGVEFFKASLFVDDELNVPIRLVVHGWPQSDGDKPPLIEEYTYVDLRLNVGLTDADFSETKLNSPGVHAVKTTASVSK